MLATEALSLGYRSGSQVLRDVSIEIPDGKIVGVLGSNGAGKTTLIRGIIGALPLVQGKVYVDGTPLSPHNPVEAVRRGIAHVPEGRQIFAELDVEENLRLGARGASSRLTENLDRVFDLFPVLASRRRQRGGTLSGGEQQMLAIARGLMASPKYLLVDEPSLGLAPNLISDMFSKLYEICTKNEIGLLLGEQNHAIVRYCEKVLILGEGRIIKAAKASEISSEEIFALYMGENDGPPRDHEA